MSRHPDNDGDRFHELHNSMYDAMVSLLFDRFTVHTERLEAHINQMERRIMSTLQDAMAEVAKVGVAVKNLRQQLADAKAAGGATAEQLGEIIAGLEADLAEPAAVAASTAAAAVAVDPAVADAPVPPVIPAA